MRFLTRSGWLAAINTEGPQWVVPTRLAVGVLLLCPIDGSIQQLFTFYHVDQAALSVGAVAAGGLLRAVEVLVGLSFVAGLGTRLAGYAAVAIFAVRAVANCAHPFERDSSLRPFIVPGLCLSGSGSPPKAAR